MKGEWKSVKLGFGVLCAMTSGILLMPVWPADSWDFPDTVC